jgi:hypothetical protein
MLKLSKVRLNVESKRQKGLAWTWLIKERYLVWKIEGKAGKAGNLSMIIFADTFICYLYNC